MMLAEFSSTHLEILSRYLFRSGNTEHPGDKFYNTTVEIMPDDHVKKQNGVLDNTERQNIYPRTSDGFLVIDKFNHVTGLAEGTIDKSIGDIHSMRLHVRQPSETWVILSEVIAPPLHFFSCFSKDPSIDTHKDAFIRQICIL